MNSRNCLSEWLEGANLKGWGTNLLFLWFSLENSMELKKMDGAEAPWRSLDLPMTCDILFLQIETMDKFFASGKIHHLIFFYQEPDTDVKDPGKSIHVSLNLTNGVNLKTN